MRRQRGWRVREGCIEMPKKMELKLKREAAKKGLKGERADKYVYGTLQKVTNWKPHKKNK